MKGAMWCFPECQKWFVGNFRLLLARILMSWSTTQKKMSWLSFMPHGVDIVRTWPPSTKNWRKRWVWYMRCFVHLFGSFMTCMSSHVSTRFHLLRILDTLPHPYSPPTPHPQKWKKKLLRTRKKRKWFVLGIFFFFLKSRAAAIVSEAEAEQQKKRDIWCTCASH